MKRHTLIILRRAALVLWVVTGLWSAWLAFGGFVSITVGPIHASSRDTRNPLLMAGIGAVAFGLLTWRLGDRAGLDAKWLWVRQSVRGHDRRGPRSGGQSGSCPCSSRWPAQVWTRISGPALRRCGSTRR